MLILFIILDGHDGGLVGILELELREDCRGLLGGGVRQVLDVADLRGFEKTLEVFGGGGGRGILGGRLLGRWGCGCGWWRCLLGGNFVIGLVDEKKGYGLVKLQ